MNKFTPFLLLLCCSMISAQLPQSILVQTEKITAFDENYMGSIYKESKPKPSIIIHEKSGSYDAKLRYNIYSDIIEYKNNDKTFSLLKSSPVHIKIGEDYYYYCNFKTKRKSPRKGYFVLVDQTEDYRIYKKYKLDIVEPKLKAALSSSEDIPGKLKLTTTYYLEENNIVIELPLKKKEMLAMFQSNQSKLKDFFKKEKIKLKKEGDLIKFVSHFNALNDNAPRKRGLLSSLNQK